MKTPAFWRAIHSLAHPISLVAVLALLFNDHWLRIEAPSWLTGKLGDFAWLVFAPFICAAVFALFMRARQQERLVGGLAFGFIGVWFTLAKTTPLVHGWTLDVLEMVVSYRGTLRIDPTDLLALPALLIGWRIWRSALNTAETLQPRAWVLLALGMVATVATSGSPHDYGVVRLCVADNKIYAFHLTDYSETIRYLVSTDGGLNWEITDSAWITPTLPCLENIPPTYTLYRPPDSVNQEVVSREGIFRYLEGHAIEYSTDGGRIWSTEFDLSVISFEAREMYYRYVWHKSFVPGPFDALVDERSGNVILAMGHDGVLVRTPNGIWQWVAVGDYHYRQYDPYMARQVLFYLEYAKAIFFGMLVAITIARPFTGLRALRIFGIIILWMFWAALLILFSPQLTTAFPINMIALPILLIYGPILLFRGGIEVHRKQPTALLIIGALSVGSGLLFVLPYILWTQGTIPLYGNAIVYSLIIGIAALITSRLHLQRQYPELFKIKLSKKQKIAQLLAAGELVADDDEDAPLLP